MNRKQTKPPKDKAAEAAEQEKKAEYRKKISKLMISPELSAALTISLLHGNVNCADGESGAASLDLATPMKEFREQSGKLQSGEDNRPSSFGDGGRGNNRPVPKRCRAKGDPARMR